MSLSVEHTVGHVATTHPHSVKVFQRHGIDFCCGGGRTLVEACARKGLDPAVVVDEIQAAVPQGPSAVRWDERPVDDLIEHILNSHHRPLDEELPRLEFLARKVARVHGEHRPHLDEILHIFLELRDELVHHMEKEEQILFPWIATGRLPAPTGPIEVMEAEHESVGELLRHLRELTSDFMPPPEACGSWRALWQGLEALEVDLHEHIHLENNVLHPRARG